MKVLHRTFVIKNKYYYKKDSKEKLAILDFCVCKKKTVSKQHFFNLKWCKNNGFFFHSLAMFIVLQSDVQNSNES